MLRPLHRETEDAVVSPLWAVQGQEVGCEIFWGSFSHNWSEKIDLVDQKKWILINIIEKVNSVVIMSL